MTESNYFRMFDLPLTYSLDQAALSARYRELQKIYHPDRYAGKGAQDIRVAVQKASHVNQAFDVLKSPVSRARYLLELAGIDVDIERQITSDSGFLMQQMELREQLQEIAELAGSDSVARLDTLAEQARDIFSVLETRFAGDYASGDYNDAAQTVAKMQFFAKLLREIDELEERLDR